MKTLQDVSALVLAEVARAQAQWGTSLGPYCAIDEKNTLNDWAAYINIYLGHATGMGASKEEVVRGLRKAAGLTLAALLYAENDALAPRHYDGQERPASLPEIQSVKVFSITEDDWMAGATLEECKAEYIKSYGGDAYANEPEVFADAHELDDEAMNRMKFSEEDGHSADLQRAAQQDDCRR